MRTFLHRLLDLARARGFDAAGGGRRWEGARTAPRPGDVIVIGADSHVIRGEPLRDRERLIWTLDLRPA